jgi:ABC-type antimicrobial peptide transport system permease subunit
MNKFLNISELLRLSFDSLGKNRVRTVLSIVGIVIGISTLVIVLGISSAAEGFIREQLASFGSDTVFVEVKVPNADAMASGAARGAGVQVKTMKVEDVIGARKLQNVKNTYGAVIGQEKAVYRGNNKKTFVYGVQPAFVQIDATKVAVGRFFTDAEENSLAKVAVLGPDIKEQLFGNEDPIGKFIRIRNTNFKVIGITEKRGAAFFQNYDEYVYLPLKTEQKLLLGYDYLPYFVVQVKDPKNMDVVADDLKSFLRRQHNIQGDDEKKDDFVIETSEDSMNSISVVFGAVSLLFGAIAFGSILMNVN